MLIAAKLANVFAISKSALFILPSQQERDVSDPAEAFRRMLERFTDFNDGFLNGSFLFRHRWKVKNRNPWGEWCGEEKKGLRLNARKPASILVRPEGFEPPTHCLEGTKEKRKTKD